MSEINPGKKFLNENFFVCCGLAILFIFFSIVACKSEGSAGGADPYNHYRIARYAFSYPHLFLDLWGKPIFTFFSSPFAQFGFKGIKIFNITCAAFSGWCCYKISKKLNLDDAPLVIVFMWFAPMYFLVSVSVLTEIVFGLVFISAVYFFIREKYLWSAIIISVLPFAREEGIIILPMFLLMLVIRRQYKFIPLLAWSFIFFTIAGYFHYHDILWLLHQNPYDGNIDYYGHGELFHFVNSYGEIIGLPLAILLVMGIANLFYKIFSSRKKDHPYLPEEIILIFGGAGIYLAGHSYVWWKGLHGSLGLTRVMAGIIPAVAIICLEGYTLLRKIFSFNKFVRYAFTIAVLFFVLRVPYEQKLVPIDIGPDQVVMKKTSQWMEENGLTNHLIYYYDQYFWFSLNKNPYDTTVIREQLPGKDFPENGVPDGSIVIWDSHFGPNEGGMPLEKLQNNPHFQLLKTFSPEVSFSFWDVPYEIYIFRKTNGKSI